MSHAPRSPSGFSLIEVLVSVLLTGTLLVSLSALFQSALLKERLTQETNVAATRAAERLEALVALPIGAADLVPGTYTETLDGGFERRTFIVLNVPTAGARTIKVSVTRNSSARAVTFVAVRPR